MNCHESTFCNMRSLLQYVDCHHSSVLNVEYLLYESQGSMIPKPRFLQKRIEEVEIGTFKSIATISVTETVYDALSVFVERRVSALPVINEQGIDYGFVFPQPKVYVICLLLLSGF